MAITVTHYLAALSIPLIVAIVNLILTKEYDNIRSYLGHIFKKVKVKKAEVPFIALEIKNMIRELRKIKLKVVLELFSLIFYLMMLIGANAYYYHFIKNNLFAWDDIALIALFDVLYILAFVTSCKLIKKHVITFKELKKMYLDKVKSSKSENVITNFII